MTERRSTFNNQGDKKVMEDEMSAVHTCRYCLYGLYLINHHCYFFLLYVALGQSFALTCLVFLIDQMLKKNIDIVCFDVQRNFKDPFVDDGLIEVIYFKDAWHGNDFLPSKDQGECLVQVS
ncbi:hypothetical protein CK203_108234 [Vitis vinifera]|uniref:Uncharacterized protein n=1 Tax=Vitis vinifera TaxID=29760 RepID=A0A438E4P5_VITVI|nr:hypothetical protein CK203_108234 [Vitis vinifera]